MKKLLISGIVVIVLAVAAYFYATRPIAQIPVETADKTNTQVPESSETASTTAKADAQIYIIDQNLSKAEYRLGELLNGKPFEVVGVTNQVTADISIDPKAIENTKIGTIKINAQTLKTDSDRRDSAVARFILKSAEPQNQFITFEPKKISGLSSAMAPTDTQKFMVEGSITIAGVTKPSSFIVTAKIAKDGVITGTASGVVRRGDFGLVIPNIPFVANVDEDVKLNFYFALKKK